MVASSGVGVFVVGLAWLAQYVVAVPRVQHDLPKSPKKIIPKCDPEKKEDTLEDHINKFMLSLYLMNLKHEDMVCQLFPYNFQVKEST